MGRGNADEGDEEEGEEEEEKQRSWNKKTKRKTGRDRVIGKGRERANGEELL